MKEIGTPSTISEYFSVYKATQKNGLMGAEKFKYVKIAYLCSFTANGIKEVLSVKCSQSGINAGLFIAPYNQHMQQILDKGSALYDFDPDIVIVFIDKKNLFGQDYYSYGCLSQEERKAMIQGFSAQLSNIAKILKDNTRATIIFHNLEVPVCSSLGILENKIPLGIIESVRMLNNLLSESFRHDPRIFLFDYDAFASKHGKSNICDAKMYYLADMNLHLNYIIPLCDSYLSYIKPILGISKKCLVLDLDNTLWGGVLGEDGLEGIRLGPTTQGRPFLDFQRYILSLHQRGVILAVNSSNNFSEAREVFRKHPFMVLKEEHFSCLKINWENKAANMKAIAEELGVGTDSMVFIDDDKLNREIVRKSMPEVSVVDLPDDPAFFLQAVSEIGDFNTLQLTGEDRKKGRMYTEQKMRKEFSDSVSDITDYLEGLNMVVTIERAQDSNIPRIAQLTQKTNQFNMTTRRYQEADIRGFATDGSFLVLAVDVKDKFGDNGITGVVIVKKESGSWKLDTFLLSCRVIGRRVEQAMLGYVLKKLKEAKIKTLTAEFIHTAKNIPAINFYKENGFKFIKDEGNKQLWHYDFKEGYSYPEFIRVIEKG